MLRDNDAQDIQKFDNGRELWPTIGAAPVLLL